jgi:transcriptional regulator with PAS, ATPase and Fis domain
MADMDKIMENLNTATLACDANFKVIYANEKCKKMFKASLQVENFVGNNMADCHKPETMDKLKVLFAEYKHKTRNLNYYTIKTPDGTLTLVNVPFYNDDTFGGVVEFIFEGVLG